MSAKTFKNKNEGRRENLYLVPVAMVLALVPLVIRYHSYVAVRDVYLYEYEKFAEEAADYMCWGKSMVLLAAAVLMILCMLWRAFADSNAKWKWTILWIPLGIYGLMSILSACFSEYGYIVLRGADEQFESIWVLLAYCVCTVYGFYMVNDEKTVRKIIKILGVGVSVICLYGLVELCYKNPVTTVLGRYLVYPFELAYEYGAALEPEINIDTLFLTFFNSNYVGSYMAITVPVMFAGFLALKKKGEKVWFALLIVIQLVLLTASEARSGFFGLFGALVVFAFLYAGELKKHWRKIVIGAGVVLVTGIAADACLGFSMTNRMLHAFDGMDGEEMKLESVETLDDCIRLTYEGNTLTVVYNGYESEESFTTACDGETVVYTLNEEGIYQTEDERFTVFELAKTGSEKGDWFDVGIKGYRWRFIDGKENGGYYYISEKNYPEKIVSAESAWGSKYYGFASSRGYIWAKTVPLLKKTLLLGSGPDTFYQVYPHNDYVAEKNYLGEIIVTRPHSVYLQTGVQTGVISLVALIAFAGMYLVSSFKILTKCRNTFSSHIGKGITAGVTGYMITALVNDSIVGIAQMFWMLIGIGMAVNALVRREARNQ